MKHIKRVSKSKPGSADVWQDVLCTVAATVVSLLGAKGGNVPLVTWVDEKCQPSTLLES
ncbi:MAG: hypothetical protein IT366_20560 [Candidatus Hydrogenedentes bacterium]|nr:hypothetical protein [Candidatus Hydrogenedentota bacterium]